MPKKFNWFNNQKGVIKLLPVLLIIAAVGIISFLLISSIVRFNNGFFGNLFSKPASHASNALAPLYSDQAANVLGLHRLVNGEYAVIQLGGKNSNKTVKSSFTLENGQKVNIESAEGAIF